ncbi:MAG TPA: PilZ domain-containing protein [Bacteroidales bacterium]|nr:PilZ domain-containing protein [Bacteroidales bacterium]
MEWINIRGKIQITSEDGSVLEAMITDKTEDAINFSIPADDRRFKFFQAGEKVEAVVFERNKGMRFEGVISGRIVAEAPTYTISQLSGWKSVQRRDNVRVPCSEPLTYTANRFIIDSVAFSRDVSRVEDEISKYMKEGLISDISAGGMKFSCDEDIKEGSRIILRFHVQKNVLMLRGTVMHRQLIINPAGTRYFYGIKFEDISEKTQEMIVNHVFQLMRKTQRK